MAKMKSKNFIQKITDVAKNYKTLYVMGCFGAPLTDDHKSRYINNGSGNGYNAQAGRKAIINAATDDTFGFDCVCLIKGILWGWNGDKSKTYGGAVYLANDVPDIDANAMFDKCSEKSASGWADMIPGEALWCSGHIGVYIGDGLAVECTPIWDNKVQITAVANIGAKSGYNARKWTKHGKLPYIDYSDQQDAAPSTDKSSAESDTIVAKAVDELADEVIAGKWGNGDDRKSRLTAAGYDYAAVQYAVNAKLHGQTAKKTNEEIAQEVIAGKWGNGQERIDSLTAAGYDYKAIQDLVNKKM